MLIAVAVGVFYIWSARTEDASWNFGQRQTDYYNLLVDGMLDGHLSLKVDVPPELLAIADPYNPANRPPGVGLHDASLYHGKYYLYFGVAPVVTLLLPFRILTHTALPVPAAVVIFSYAGFLVSGCTWWLVRRRYFPGASVVLSALLLLALGTASLIPLLVRRANIWELPISGGYFFSAVAILCVYQTLHSRRRGAAWLAGASLALGLAIASRPTYLYAIGLLLVPLIWHWRSRRWSSDPRFAVEGVPSPREATRGRAGDGFRHFIAYAAAAVIPLALVGLAMAAYNYARFGNPLEFGVAYQFSGIYEAKARHFSWTYLPYNLGVYGLGALDWSLYFPFIHEAQLPAWPDGHFGIEEPFGVLKHVVLVWFALLSPLALLGRSAEDRSRLGSWLAAVAAVGLGTMFTLGFFYAAIGRYEADFMPAYTLLATIGVFGVERWARGRASAWQRLVTPILGGVAIASAAMAVLFSLVIYDNFQRQSPRAYALLARICDYPASWLERQVRGRTGAVEMTLQFPEHAASRREPLLKVGWYRAGDHVFVEYDSGTRVRFGFAHDFGGQEFSRWLTVEPGRPYRLRVEMGSLYPPEEDPIYDSLDAGAATLIGRHLRVELNGDVLINAYERYPAAAPDRVLVGRDDPDYGTTFSGRITGYARDADIARVVRRNAADPLIARERAEGRDFDRVTMMVSLRERRPVGAHEPLVTTGYTGAVDFLYVDYVDTTHVRFGLEHSGKPGIYSPTIDWPDQQPRAIDVSLGSFPNGRQSTAADQLRVVLKVDGRVIWDTPARFYRADPADIFVGRNPVGGTACGPEFSGTISDVQRISTSGN
jgi:hypothetical protein